MAHWYIDRTISGGNGTDPSTAFPSVLSVSWTPGDTAWIRRTHFEPIADGQVIGPNPTENDAFSQWSRVVGWPISGDPFYDVRPSVASLWDSDAPAGILGVTFPILSNSNNSATVGIHLGKQCGIHNITFVGCGGAVAQPFDALGMTFHQCLVDNFAVFGPNQYYSTLDRQLPFQIGKVIWAFSSALTTGQWELDMHARHLVVHSMSLLGGGLLRISSNDNRIGLLEIQTQSMATLFAANADIQQEGNWGKSPVVINRIIGFRPYIGIGSGAQEPGACVRIDDYYGDGPMIVGFSSNVRTRVASSTEAKHDDARVLVYDVFSVSADAQRYWDSRHKMPAIRKPFDVESGTAMTIRIPIYVDSTAVFSPTNGGMRVYFQCRGGGPVYCHSQNLIVGTPAKWVGSMCVGGSAWLFSCAWTPKETAVGVFLDVHLPHYTQSASGTGLTAYALIGEPFKV